MRTFNPNLAQELLRVRCADCGTGADLTLEQCPACGSSSWEADVWPPYATLAQEDWENTRLARDPGA